MASEKRGISLQIIFSILYPPLYLSSQIPILLAEGLNYFPWPIVSVHQIRISNIEMRTVFKAYAANKFE